MKEKIRRITALVGVIVLVALYAATIVIALSGNANWSKWLMVSIALTVIVPVIIYVLSIFLRGGTEDTLTRALRNHTPEDKRDRNFTDFKEDIEDKQ